MNRHTILFVTSVITFVFSSSLYIRRQLRKVRKNASPAIKVNPCPSGKGWGKVYSLYKDDEILDVSQGYIKIDKRQDADGGIPYDGNKERFVFQNIHCYKKDTKVTFDIYQASYNGFLFEIARNVNIDNNNI